MPARRAAVVGVLLLLALAGCANGPGPATPTPTPVATAVQPGPPPLVQVIPSAAVRVDGVDASVEFEPASRRALENAQIELKTEDPTLGQLPGWKDGSDTVHLPITDDELVLATTPPRGRVRTDGALMLSRMGSDVAYSDLQVDLDGSHVTGTVDGRPITVFDLDLSRAHVEDLSSLPPTVVEIHGRMTDEARRELRDHLGVDLSADDTRVGLELRLRPM